MKFTVTRIRHCPNGQAIEIPTVYDTQDGWTESEAVKREHENALVFLKPGEYSIKVEPYVEKLATNESHMWPDS